MFARFSILAVFILSFRKAESFRLNGKQLTGSVEFQDASDAPEELTKGSCLNIALKDSTDFTTADKELASTTDKDIIKSYKDDKKLKYKINLPDTEFNSKKKYSVSAVLNVGWCKEESDEIDSGEWIRDQDYLTDTQFMIDGLEKCSKRSSKECNGPTLSVVKSKQEDNTEKNKSEDEKKENKKKNDNKKDDK